MCIAAMGVVNEPILAVAAAVSAAAFRDYLHPSCHAHHTCPTNVLRSAAQVHRIKVRLPADYAASSSNTTSASDSHSTPEATSAAAAAAKKTASHPSILSSLFGHKDAENDSKSDAAIPDETTPEVSYHDRRFLQVLQSCGKELNEACKRKLLQAYQVSGRSMRP